MEARWWWAQSLAAHQSSVLHQGTIDLWLEMTRRAIDCGHRAVATCPPRSPDRLTMACFVADVVLDACTFAPWAIAPQLPAVLQSLDQHCALMPPQMAAPRRVRALPMRLAAGASIAEALIVLAESSDALRGTTWTGPLADATRATARLLGNLGDAERALALLDEAAAGIERSTEATTGQPKPPWLQHALDDVRAGREPAPLDFDNLTGRQVEEASAALVQASDLTHARRATLVDRAMVLLELGHATEAILALDELLALPNPILRTLARLNRGIARFEAGDAAGAEQDLEAAVAAAGGPAPLGWPIVAYLRARIATALGREEARSALQFAAQLTKGTGLEWRTLAALAAHEASIAPADALQTYRTMAAVIAESRRSSLGYRLDSSGLRDKEGHLSAAVRLAADGGAWRAALDIIETFKARELRAIRLRAASRRARASPSMTSSPHSGRPTRSQSTSTSTGSPTSSPPSGCAPAPSWWRASSWPRVSSRRSSGGARTSARRARTRSCSIPRHTRPSPWRTSSRGWSSPSSTAPPTS